MDPAHFTIQPHAHQISSPLKESTVADRRYNSIQNPLLRRSSRNRLDPAAVLCEPVILETLRRATAQERPQIQAQFSTLPILATPPHIWREATRFGQKCRNHGFNAGSLDSIIAAIAIHHDAELITFDADFLAISHHSTLRVRLLAREL
jgi:predicted nucleic acid-binding protein